MKRILYLYNPYAGHQAHRQMLDTVLQKCMQKGISAIAHRLFTMKPDTALEEFFSCAEQFFDAVFVAGGDGTLNQMLNVAMQHNCRLPMGLLPMGTCNDMVRSLGLPSDPYKCLDYYLDCVQEGESFCVDLGKLTAGDKTTYFLNSVAGGVFVNVSHKTKPEAKKIFGPLAYYATAVGELTDMRPFHLRIETEDGVLDESALLFLMLNGTDVAGFSDIIGHSDMQDGYLDILVVRAGKLWDSLRAGLQILNVLKSAKTICQIRCRRCMVSAEPAPIVSIDGERGEPLPYTVELVPMALPLVGKSVPRSVEKGKKVRPQSEVCTNKAQSLAEYLAKAWSVCAPEQKEDGRCTLVT